MAGRFDNIQRQKFGTVRAKEQGDQATATARKTIRASRGFLEAVPIGCGAGGLDRP